MSHSLGIAIESLVAFLLLVTIGYCMLLNSRLKRLKADESSLKAIGELISATEIAERAIGGLKLTVPSSTRTLNAQLIAAGAISISLQEQLAEGDYVVRRLSKIASAARSPSTPLPAPEPAPGCGRHQSFKRQYLQVQRRSPRQRRSSPSAEGLTASPHGFAS